MKKIVFVLFLFFPFLSFGQQQNNIEKCDSLLGALSQPIYTAQDTTTILFLAEVAHACFESQRADTGYAIAAQALRLAERLNYQYGMGITYLCLGKAMGFTNYTTDLEYCFKALKIFEQIKDQDKIGQAFSCIGAVYYTMQKYPQALKYFEKERKIFEQLNDSAWVGAADQSIGGTCQETGDYQKALRHEMLALQYFEKKGNINRMGIAFLNMGNTYASLREYNKALVYSFKALRAFQENPLDRYLQTTVRHDIGLIYAKIARDTVAEPYADSLVLAGRKANLAKAIEYFKASYEVYQPGDFVPLYALKDYSDALTDAGKYDEALKIYKEYTRIKDSTLSNNVELTVSRQETKREADLRNREREINVAAEKQKRTERLLSAAALLLLVVVVTTVYRSYRSQRKVNRLQQESLHQKDVLMKEIHHRVKNNLQVIGTLLDLQLDNIEDTRARKALTEGMSRVKSISLIHQQLYQNENVTNIEISKFTIDLLYQVRVVFERPGQAIVLESNIGERLFDIDTAVPLGLILNELMTNSYKYAFAGSDDGRIQISLRQRDNYYELVYADSGPGLPPDMDINNGTTLGLMIIESLSTQLGGYYKYERSKKEFIITFKDAAERKKVA